MYSYEEIKPLVEEIRLMNRAKLILIKMQGMTEAEAHRFIVKTAMDRCVKKRTVAEDIIAYHIKYEHTDRGAKEHCERKQQ